MLIGIDGNEANIKNRVGVNQYAFELLWGLYNIQKKVKPQHDFVVYLKQEPMSDLPSARAGWKYEILPGGGMWIIKKLTPHLYRTQTKPDVLFAPSHYVPPISPMPRICAVMDLGYLSAANQFRAYDYWQLRLWTAWSILVSRRVIAISEATKLDIAKRYPFSRGKIQVTPLAGDSKVKNAKVISKDIDRVKKKYGIRGDYILFLGTLKPSKNIDGLLSAWARIEKKHKNTILVIAGKKGWLFESIFEHVKTLDLEKRVIFTDFVDEQDKPALTKGAKLFALPSFWEGFGIDVVNAFVLGVPAVVSSRGSLPEVAGKAGIYVDPNVPQKIADAIDSVLKMDKKEYNKLVGNSIKQARQFDWNETAKQTLKTITRCI